MNLPIGLMRHMRSVIKFRPSKRRWRSATSFIRTQTTGRLHKLLLPILMVCSAIGFVAWNEFVPVEVLEGRVTHVRDGDTIEVGGRAIRLDALNCAELNTDLGKQARVAMQSLVSGQDLACHLDGGRTYDRETGRCYVNGNDIGRQMITAGLCGRCDAYDPLFTYAIAQWRAGPYRGKFPGYCRQF